MEGNIVVLRHDGQRVGPDLVCDIAVRRDAVGPDHDQIDGAAGHERCRCRIGDHRGRDAQALQLPGGETSSL
jgi:hypothetical protein